ncbi:AEC family transporter [Romboutsia lituseburensis]|uniref:AEC family transporter n=1 Tax=Romboutsia lituseburensis TaxID=1537 RepID=UPI00215AAF0F|nr:AEC family transporter [Romboutsia lituseburensis]MCR8744850.1 AEC family transporter [Romboutsia lituseburensis]
MSLGNVFSQILILFILIIIGYYTRKKDLLDEYTTSKLSSLTMSIFLPSMIINSMQIDYSPDMIDKIIKLLIISLVMYTISYLASYLLKFIFKSCNDLGIYQYVIMFSNVGFMGYPVVEAVLGKEAVFYTAIFNLPFNLLTITLGTYFLSKGKADYSFSIKNFINPVIISIFIGLILFVLNIKLPIFISKPLDMLGNITTPMSMIIIGSMLCASSAIDCFYNKKLYFVTIIRLIILPIAIYFVLNGQIKDSLLISIPIVISAMPAAANTAIMASEYEANTHLASQAVFFTTLFSVITIPLVSSILIK